MSRCLGVSLLLAAIVSAVGCGGGSGKSSPPPSSPSNPTPAITSISPTSVIAGAASTPITVAGTGFVSGSVAQWNGTALTTTYVSSTQLTATVPATSLINGTLADITVSSPAPGGGLSAKTTFTVNNPVPVVSAFSPANFQAGDPGSVLTLAGTGFVPSSMVLWNGTALPTTFVNGTQVTVTIPASNLTAGQVAKIAVSNPSPAGGSSAVASFNVNSPIPVISDFSPRAVSSGAAVDIKIMGSGFESNSVVRWNGADRTTTFVSSSILQVHLDATDVKSYGTGQLSVYNPGPNGSNTTPVQLLVTTTNPVITTVYSTSSYLYVDTSATASVPIYIGGINFAANATAMANGQSLVIDNQTTTSIRAELPASFLHQAGTIQIVVSNPGPPAQSTDPYYLRIDQRHISFSLDKSAVPVGSSDTQITLSGTTWPTDAVVTWNGSALATQYNSYSLTATIPASYLQRFVNATISVTSSSFQSAILDSQPFSTYLPLSVNDLKYDSRDGLLYASVPGSQGSLGNSIVAIDPTTAVITKVIAVGSEPDLMALSDDGKQLFVGLDGAGAVRPVDLTTGAAGTQFSLGGASGNYNYPYTANSLAVLPGQANSVAVSSTSGAVTIYDSGVARTINSSGRGGISGGSLAFGASASTLYVENYGLGSLAIDNSGVTSGTTLVSGGQYGLTIQYDNGKIYQSNGIVVDTSGNQTGQFLTDGVNTPLVIVSDSSLYRAWGMAGSSYNTPSKIVAFDSVTYNPVGSVALGGLNTYSNNPEHLIRWGQNGLAFHTGSQIYVLQSSIVQDQSAAPADVAVSMQAPSSATTGNSMNYTVTFTNLGPNTAFGVNGIVSVPSGIILGSITPSQGSCSGAGPIYCDLGSLANGASATVQIAITPTTAGTLSASVNISTSTTDLTASNDQSSASTTVTGSLYSATPSVTQLSPSLVQTGASSFTLTVYGTGFDSTSTVYWNGQSLPTSFDSSGQLSATVDSSRIASMGWAKVWVTNSAQSVNSSGPAILTIYKSLPVQATAMTLDPFTRQIYATLPSGATSLSGNSVVAIDPSAGTIGTPVPVGSEPSLLRETDSGKYLYIGLTGAKSLAKFNLLTQSLESTIPIRATQYNTTANYAAVGLATMPGSESTLAVDLGTSGYGIGILDISGATGTFRTKSSGTYNGSYPVFADTTHLYALSGSQFYRYTVDSNGLTQIDSSSLNGMNGYYGNFILSNGLVYGAPGGIANPSTTPPSQIAVLPLGSNNTGRAVAPDAAQGKEFVVMSSNNSIAYLQRYDLGTYTQDYQFQLPLTGNTSYNNPTYDVLRYGADGIAVRFYDISNPGSTGNQILLFQGPLVLPSELATNSAPTVSAATPASITAGSPNFYLTVTASGSGTPFLPGATAFWNSSPRTTTYVSSTQLKVAIPASDVASALSQPVSITVTNPGSNASSSVLVTVQ